MATHSSVLAWRIRGAGEPGGLTSMGSHRVRHDWSDSISRLSTTEHMHRRLWGFKRGASDPGLRLGMLDQHSSAGFRSRVQSFKTFNSLLTGVFLQKLMPMAGDFYFGWPQLNCYFTNTLWVIIFNSYTWHTCKVFQFFVKHCFQSTPPGSSPRRIQGNPKEKRRRRLI